MFTANFFRVMKEIAWNFKGSFGLQKKAKSCFCFICHFI